MIFARDRDPRLVALRRGGAFTDADHRGLALWAATCVEHVPPLLQAAEPDDP